MYSLSAPSACSTFVFAGIENAVVQFDVVGMMDRFPDPVYGVGAKRTGSGSVHEVVRGKWDPDGDAMRLALAEQVPVGVMRLRVQAGVGDMDEWMPGFDERWVDGRGNY